MRSAHAGGFLCTIADRFGITSPDLVVASSGDAGNVLYFATGKPEQYAYIKKIWTELLSTPKFISYLRLREIMDIDYLVDTVFKRQAPLDVAALERSPVNYFISVTSATTGESRYVSRSDTVDPFELLRATKALPVFFGKQVSLPWGNFIDGELGPTLEDHIKFAVRQGATKIGVIDNNSPRTHLRKVLTKLYVHMVPEGLGQAILRDVGTEAVCATSEHATLLCIQPQRLPAGVLTRDKKKLQETFEVGVQDALSLEKELRELFA